MTRTVSFFFLLLLCSCHKNDNDVLLCTPAPPALTVEVVNRAQENYIEKQALTPGDLQAKEIFDNGASQSTSIGINEHHWLFMGEIGFEEGPRTYEIHLGEIVFGVSGKVVQSTGKNGCTSSRFQEVEFRDVEWNTDHLSKGYYQVVLPL